MHYQTSGGGGVQAAQYIYTYIMFVIMIIIINASNQLENLLKIYSNLTQNKLVDVNQHKSLTITNNLQLHGFG